MTKNLPLTAVQTKLYKAILHRFHSFLLLFLCLNSIEAFSQKEQLLKKKLFLDDPHNAIESITLPNQKTIFGAWDETINTSFETASSLWITDGTEAGTKMLKSFLKEPGTGFLENITLSTDFFYFNNKVFLNARNHIDDRINFLYVTDGTEKGTFRLVDKAVVKSIYAIYHNKLYISNGTKLLTSDGTKAGTREVSAIEMPNITNLFTVNDYLIIETEKDFFVYNDRDGTLVTLPGKGTNTSVVATKDYVFFVGKDGDLWRTDGTLQGTKSIKDIAEGADVLAPKSLMATSRFAVFKSYTDKTKEKTCLWISDGNIAEPMRNFRGGVVSTDTTGFMPIPTRFDEKLYFYLNNLDQNTLASNNYLFVFHNSIASANYLENIRGVYEAQLFPFSPKVNTKEEYFYARPESPGWLEGDYTIKGFNTINDTLITLTRIETEGRTSWMKGGNKIYYNKNMQGSEPGLYAKGVCAFEVKIDTPNGTNICNDSGIRYKLVINGTENYSAGYSVVWDYKKFLNEITEPNTFSKAGTYTVHVTDNTRCTVSSSVNITKSDSLSVSIIGNNSFCPGQSTTLTTSIQDGASPYTYQWKNGANNAGTNVGTLAANAAGNYSVIVKDSRGCQGISPAYGVTQKSLPDVRITKNGGTDIVSGGSTTLSVVGAPNQTYQWYEDALAIAGAKSNTYTATKAGKYSVTVTADGCTATSEMVVVNLVLANESAEKTVLLQAYPNPTDNLIKLSITEPLNKTAQISLINTKGIAVRKWEIKQQETLLNLSELPVGEYLLKADINDQPATLKIIRQ
jgi:ELWxxDGT repeat protein